jgi:maleylpyruvate isomerase
MTARSGSIPVEGIQQMTREADQALLRDTIGILESDWHAPSLLPGWTRAHVATHLARGADRLRQVTEASLSGTHVATASATERFEELERGAERNSLELQIDLDTSASALTATWNTVTDWHRPVRFLGRTRPLAMLPVIRLHEILVHHIDLDCGFTADQVPPEAAAPLLGMVTGRVRDLDLPAIAIEADSGFTDTIGSGPGTAVARADDALLWAWLSGRATLTASDGSELPRLPLLA